MNKPVDLPLTTIDPDAIGHNDSANPTFDSVLQARLGRRAILRGAVGSAATALFGGTALSACGGSDDPTPVAAGTSPPLEKLSFVAVDKGLADAVVSTRPTRVPTPIRLPVAPRARRATSTGTSSDSPKRAANRR